MIYKIVRGDTISRWAQQGFTDTWEMFGGLELPVSTLGTSSRELPEMTEAEPFSAGAVWPVPGCI